MQAILYVGHGTRLKKGVEEAVRFLEQTKLHVDVAIQEIAFLELVEPDIVTGIEKCVAKGATSIAVIPILLLTAQHAKEDIPLELAKAKVKFPNVELTVGRPFGIHESLIETIYARIEATGEEILPEAEVLLIGRGSSDLAVLEDMQKISARLQQKYAFQNVSSCFLYGNGPKFEETIQTLKARDVKQVFIVPYLLFPGLLSVGIEKQIQACQFDTRRIHLCDSLGYNENVRNVLLERVQEVI